MTYDILANIYPKLIQYNLNTLDFEAAFASSWQLSNDGLTWTFTTASECRVVGRHAAHRRRRRLDDQHDGPAPQRCRGQLGECGGRRH